MSAYATAVLTGSPWLGVAVAGLAGARFGLLHGWICRLPRVNDIAVGIALMLFGSGLAFFFGKPFIQPSAPAAAGDPLRLLVDVPAGPGGAAGQRAVPRRRGARRRSCGGRSATPAPGSIVRIVGDSADAARAMGYDVDRVRLLATGAGGVLAGIGGAYLSLYYPGSWNEGISSARA